MRLTSFYPVAFILLALFYSCTHINSRDSLVAGEALKADSIAGGDSYEVDTLSSIITWIGSKPNGQHNGTINIDGGSVRVKDGEIIGGTFNINLKSLKVRDLPKESDQYVKLTNHLQSEDFFYTDSFPTGKFEIINIISFDSTINLDSKSEFETDYTPADLNEFMVKDPTHYATGNLTLRGITRSIKFPVKIYFRNDKLLSEAKFNIDRTDWKLSYSDESTVSNKAKDKFIYNTVNVGFSIEAEKMASTKLLLPD